VSLSLKKLFGFLAALLVFLGGLGVVSAAQSISGSVTVSNSAPVVNSITPQLPNVDPAQYFTVSVSVSDPNTLRDIQKVKIVVYANTTTQGAADSARNHYTFEWNGTTWISSPTGYIDGTSSTTPTDMSAQTGTWTFFIKLDETAEPTGWHIYAYVEDKSAASDTLTSTNAISANVYISFSLDDTTLTFSGAPGATGVAASENPTIVTVTSNVNLNINVYTQGNWGGQNYLDTIPAGNTKAAQDSAHTGEISLSTSAQALYSNVGYGKGVQKNIYWFLDIPTGIRADTYTNTLYVDVVQA